VTSSTDNSELASSAKAEPNALARWANRASASGKRKRGKVFWPFRFLYRGAPGMSLLRILWWHSLRIPALFCTLTLFRMRIWGSGHVPRHGPVLYLSNHQSVLDPVLVSVGASFRPTNSLARSTLFSNWIGTLVMHSFGGIPLSRGGHGDKQTMRRSLEILDMGQSLVIFPEGTRSDGKQIHRFRPGSMALIKRAKPMVVPVAIVGTSNAWARGKMLPTPFKPIGVMYGRPIPAEELITMDTDAMEYLRQRVIQMQQEIRQTMQFSG
jgi:1-acyl-sn-glycerol-3-phosphate acyltransferase